MKRELEIDVLRICQIATERALTVEEAAEVLERLAQEIREKGHCHE